MVARYADIWNAQWITADEIRERNALLNDLLYREGRQPGDVKRTIIRGIFCWRTDAERERLADEQRRVAALVRPISADRLIRFLRMRSATLVGTPEQIIEQLCELESAGIEELMWQYVTVDSLEALEIIAESVLPYFSGNQPCEKPAHTSTSP